MGTTITRSYRKQGNRHASEYKPNIPNCMAAVRHQMSLGNESMQAILADDSASINNVPPFMGPSLHTDHGALTLAGALGAKTRTGDELTADTASRGAGSSAAAKIQRQSFWDYYMPHGEVEQNSCGDVTGVSGGIGGYMPQMGALPETRSLRAEGQVGWGEQSDGGYFYGLSARANSGSVAWDPAKTGESGFWGGLSGPDVGVNAYATDTMFNVGYNQNLASAGIGYRQADANSDQDRGFRLSGGLPAVPSVPGSVGARGYYGDVDNDKRREFGGGLTLPLTALGIPVPASVGLDYTTETPGTDLINVAVPGASIVQSGMDLLGLNDYTPGAILDDAANDAWNYLFE